MSRAGGELRGALSRRSRRVPLRYGDYTTSQFKALLAKIGGE